MELSEEEEDYGDDDFEEEDLADVAELPAAEVSQPASDAMAPMDSGEQGAHLAGMPSDADDPLGLADLGLDPAAADDGASLQVPAQPVTGGGDDSLLGGFATGTDLLDDQPAAKEAADPFSDMFAEVTSHQ